MLHAVWDWRADVLGCVQSAERRRVILKQLSCAAQVLLTAWSLKLSTSQDFRKDGMDVGEREMIHIDMHQLFNIFCCKKKEMTE